MASHLLLAFLLLPSAPVAAGGAGLAGASSKAAQHGASPKESAAVQKQRADAEAAVRHAEAFAAALGHIIRIDEIANGEAHVPNASKALDGEVQQLEQSLRVLNATAQPSHLAGPSVKDNMQTITHAQSAIHALSMLRDGPLRAESRILDEQARRAAEGTQMAAREAAREVRYRTDRLAQSLAGSAQQSEGIEDGAAGLQRRADNAADATERRAELLAKRVEANLRRNMDASEQQIGMHAHLMEKSSAPGFLAARVGTSGSAFQALPVLAIAGGMGLALASGIARRFETRTAACVNVPTEALG